MPCLKVASIRQISGCFLPKKQAFSHFFRKSTLNLLNLKFFGPSMPPLNLLGFETQHPQGILAVHSVKPVRVTRQSSSWRQVGVGDSMGMLAADRSRVFMVPIGSPYQSLQKSGNPCADCVFILWYYNSSKKFSVGSHRYIELTIFTHSLLP